MIGLGEGRATVVGRRRGRSRYGREGLPFVVKELMSRVVRKLWDSLSSGPDARIDTFVGWSRLELWLGALWLEKGPG